MVNRLKFFLAILVFQFGLIGCTQCGGPNSGVSSGPTNAEGLVIAVTQEFENLNPIISTMMTTSYIRGFSLHPISRINKDWKWECSLCTELPSLENGRVKIFEENGQKKLTSQWEIKENAKWGDGTPITGEDFKLSWEIGKSPKVAVGEKKNYLAIEKVEVDSENPKKFSITLEKPYYDFYALSHTKIGLVPSHLERPIWEKTKNSSGAYEKQSTFSTDPTNPGLYNGPYLLEEIKLGSHITMVPNPNYYGDAPKIQKISIKLIPNTQTLEANLFSGSVDMLSIVTLTFDQALTLQDKLEKDPKLANKYDVLFSQGLIYEHIDLNLANETLQDLRVRKAIRFGIDLDELTTALFRGKQKPALHSVHPMDEYFTENVDKYGFKPERSAELLEEAGWKLRDDKYRYKDGKKLSISLMTTAQNKTREQVQVFIQQQLKEVGMEVTLKTQPARIFFGETMRKKKYPGMGMYAWISSPDSPPRSILHSSMIPTSKNSYSGQNRTGWVNAKADEALDAIAIEFDLQKRKALMETVMQEYNKEVPVVPLYFRADVAVTPKNLKNYFVTGHQVAGSNWAEYWTLE